jgi:DNA repair protein RecO (recombination protein O)
MNFRDRGIIISKRPLKERSCIITIFTEKHGIYSGVMQQYNKKTGDSLAESNLVDFFWNARLHEHIGLARAELIKSYNVPIMMNKTKLYAFNSIVSLLKIAFCEREPHNNLFPALLDFVEGFKENFSLLQYIQLELAILAETGYELQLSHCAVSNSQTDLFYVSPKSGRAVSQQAGAEYESKLLKLPKFLVENKTISNTDISDAFKLTSYFFERYIFPNKPQPAARLCLIEHLIQN